MPEVKDKEWAKNEIDHFILKELEDKNLSPNEEADKERLAKRVGSVNLKYSSLSVSRSLDKCYLLNATFFKCRIQKT